MAKKRLPAAVSEEEPKKSATASENQNQQDAVQEEEQPLWVKMARAARENGHGKATSVLQGMSDRGELTDSDRKQVRDYALKKQVRRGTPDSGENGTISKIAGPISYEDLSAQADRELEEYQQTDAYRQKQNQKQSQMQEIRTDAELQDYLNSEKKDVDTKEKELQARSDYYKNIIREENDRKIMESDLAEIAGMPEEDRTVLENYVKAKGKRDILTSIGPFIPAAGLESQIIPIYTLEQKYGKDKIDELASSYSRYLDEQEAQKIQEKTVGAVDSVPGAILHNVLGFPARAVGGIMGTIGRVQEFGNVDKRYSTLETYRPTDALSIYGNTVQNATARNIEGDGGNAGRKALSMGYQGIVSAADSLLRIAMTGGNKGLSLGLMATGAFGNAMSEATAQGATPEQALILSTVKAGLEVATEKIPLDNLLNVAKSAPTKIGPALLNALKQAGVEATSEEVGLIGELLAEAVILQEKSGYQQKIGELVANGKSYDDAKEQANWEILDEALQTAIVSGFSGALSSAGASLFARAVNGKNGTGQSSAEAQSDEQGEEQQHPIMVDQQTDNSNSEAKNATQRKSGMDAVKNSFLNVLGGKRKSNGTATETVIDSGMQPVYNGITEQQGGIQDAGTADQLQRTDGTGLPGRNERGRVLGIYPESLPVSGQASRTVGERTQMVSGGIQEESGGSNFSDELRVPRILRVSSELQGAQSNRGTPTYTVQETTGNQEGYEKALADGRNSDKQNGWCVTPKSAQELRDGNIRTFMNENGTVGVGVAPDGDIVAVFKNKNGGPRKALDTMMPIAIEQGGNRLDCYGEGLANLYAKYGFEPVARVEFNPEYANPGWTPDKGNPYIYVMMHNGDSAETVVGKMGIYPQYTDEQLNALPTYGKDDYDSAIAYRDSLMKQREADTQYGDSGMDHSSVGAANRDFAGTAAYDELLTDGNVQPARASDAKYEEVPIRDTYGRKVSGNAQNVMNSDVISERDITTAKQLIAEGAFGHDTQKMADVRDRVYKEIQSRNISDSVREVTRAAASGKLSEYDVAKAQTLFAMLTKKEGKAAQNMAGELLVDMQQMATQSARQLNMFKLLRMLTPEGQLSAVKSSVQRYVDNLNKSRSEKKQVNVEIPEELEQDYLDAARSGDEGKQKEAEQQILKFAAAQIPATLGEKFNALRHMGMLGSPMTHIRNFGATGAFRPMASIKRTISAAIQAVTLDKQNRTAAVIGVGKESRELLNWAEADAKTETAKSMMQGTYQNGDDARNAVSEYRTTFKNKGLESTRKFISNALEAEDMVWKKREYALSLASFLKSRGYTAKQAQSGAIPASVMDEGRQFAVQEALKSTFNDRNYFSDLLSKFRKKGNRPMDKALNIMAEGILPYTRTPANVGVRGLEYSPAGLAKGFIDLAVNVRSGKKTAAQCIDEIAAGLTGTGVMALGAGLAAGMIPGVRLVGKIPEDDEEEENTQEYAIEIGGVSIGIGWVAPTTIPLFIGANLYNRFKSAAGDGDLDAWDIASSIIGSLQSSLDPVLELSCMSGLNDAIEKMSYEDTAGEKLTSLVYNAATGYFLQIIPTTFGQFEKAVEKNKKSTYTNAENQEQRMVERTIASIFRKLPGDPYQIDKVDAYGNIVKEPDNPVLRALNAFVNPSSVQKIDRSPLTMEIKRLNAAQPVDVSTPAISKIISFTDKDGVAHSRYRLSAQEFSTVEKAQKTTQFEILNSLIQTDTYQAMNEAEKAKAFQYVYDYAREKALEGAIDGYQGGSAWMDGIDGNEANAIMQKVISGSFSDAVGALADKDGKENATGNLDRVYAIYDSMDGGMQEEFRKTASKKVSYYLDAKESGISTETFAGLYRTFDELDKREDLKPAQKEQQWVYELKKAQEAGTITKNQMDTLKEKMGYFQFFRPDGGSVEKLTVAGLGADNAKKIANAISTLKPESGYKTVRDVQKAESISKSGMAEKDKITALKAYLTDVQDENLDQMIDLGFNSGDYVAALRIYDDESDAGGKGTKQRIIQRYRDEFGVDNATATAIYNIYH